MKSQNSESLDKNTKLVGEPEWVDGFLDINNGLFADYAAQEFYISNQDIWWNQGNETKPNFEEFSQMQFSQLPPTTAATFHSELNGKMTIKKEYIKRLFKVVIPFPNDNNPKDPIVKYYYVSKILNYSGNHLVNVELELDLWSTYLIQNEKLELWTSRFNPDWERDQPNQPKLIKRPFRIDLNKTIDPNVFNVKLLRYTSPAQQIKIIASKKYDNPESKPTKHNLADICTYYVFETKTTNRVVYDKNHLVLIPVLFEKADATFENKQGFSDVKLISEIRSQDIFFASEQTYPLEANITTWKAHRYFLNSEKNLDKLINESKDPTNELHGLGRFVGKFFGTNFFNLKHYNEKLKVDLKVDGQTWTNAPIDDFILWDLTRSKAINGVPNSDYDLRGFSCFRLYPNTTNLYSPPNIEWNDEIKNSFLNNARPFNNDDGAITFFSSSFIFSNGFLFLSSIKEFQAKTGLITFEDSYFEWLKNSKINMDNQINVANQQMGFNFAKTAIEGTVNGVINPISILGTASSLIGQSIQFLNTRRSIMIQEEQAFKTASNQLKTNDLLFANSYSILKNSPEGFAIDILPEKKVGIVMFGGTYRIEANQFNYYGFTQDFVKIDNETLKTINKGYLVWPSYFEGLAFLNEAFSPQIRQLLIQMLKNGVRIATKDEVEKGFK